MKSRTRLFLRTRFASCILTAVAAALLIVAVLAAQSLGKNDRDRAKQMLVALEEAIKKTYYDPAYHGLDLDAQFKRASDKVEQAQSLGQALGIIAQALIDFDDSHLFFIPPTHTTKVEYGWKMGMLGDRC